MSNELIIAIVGLIGSLSGSVLGVIGSAKLITYRISQLEKQMREQCENCTKLDDRVGKIEEKQAVMEEKMKVANHRIDDLERRTHEKN